MAKGRIIHSADLSQLFCFFLIYIRMKFSAFQLFLVPVLVASLKCCTDEI